MQDMLGMRGEAVRQRRGEESNSCIHLQIHLATKYIFESETELGDKKLSDSFYQRQGGKDWDMKFYVWRGNPDLKEGDKMVKG